MRVTLLPGSLQAALTVATSTWTSRTQILPILSCVLLEATPDGGLTLSGTDLESRAARSVSARVDEAGAVAVPPDALKSFLDAVPAGEPLTLTVDGRHKAELVCGRTRVKVAGHDPETFPVAPSFDEPSSDTTLGADALRDLIGSVAHAVASDDSRPVLAGILLRATDGGLTAVAADGFRLALRTVGLADQVDLDVIVHGRALVKAARLLDKATSARLTVDAGQSMVRLDSEVGQWSMRLIEGQFPDFRRIIPTDVPCAITLDRSELQRACRLIRGVMTETTNDNGRKSRTAMAQLVVGADTVTISASGTDGDQEAEITLPATLDRGDGLAITFNGAYLTDAVEVLDAERLTLELVGPVSPAILRPDGEDRSHLQILMPMNPKATR